MSRCCQPLALQYYHCFYCHRWFCGNLGVSLHCVLLRQQWPYEATMTTTTEAMHAQDQQGRAQGPRR